MIQFHAVEKSFGSDILLNGASFMIGKGEKCGLVGRNGSGKSTLLRMIVGEDTEDGGSISMPKGYRLGYLQQHIAFTEKSIIAETALGLPNGKEEEVYLAETILSGLGFSAEEIENTPEALSGGYQLRLHLAKVLVSDPDCLLLDEPTNYLDIVSIRWLEGFLRTWKKEFLLITHDRAFMDNVTTHTLGIQRQQVRKSEGGTEAYFAQILQEEEVREKTRQNLEKKREHMESFVRRFGAKATKAAQAQSKVKAMERLPTLEKLAQIHGLDFAFNQAPFPGKKMIAANEVFFRYQPQQPLIDGFSLAVEKNEVVAIVGKNGRGKSTLLKLLTGELSPEKGQVEVSPNVSIGYFGQTNIDLLSPNRTIEQEIAAGNPELKHGDVRSICGIVMFSGDKAKKKISVLSGGERSRVLLGKIIASPCNILFLDEPTHHLDMESIEALIRAIKEFQGAVVIVTHSEDILEQIPLTKMVVCKKNGQKCLLGDYSKFLEQDGWEEGIPVKRKGRGTKDAKKIQARLRQEKSNLLRPYKEKIHKLEMEVETLEKEQAEVEEQLLLALQDNDGKKISFLSARRNGIERKIDESFDALETLNGELIRCEKEFDQTH